LDFVRTVIAALRAAILLKAGGKPRRKVQRDVYEGAILLEVSLGEANGCTFLT